MRKKRPTFRKQKALQAYDSPEELFGKLPNRAKSHGYLRGPQADVLRDYLEAQKDSDIAMELPTGTGKTTVGLLIAEWRRRISGKKVAYLTLTNQLAGQVLKEAEKLGISYADLRGTKESRNVAEVGRYQGAHAVGITTYSNLFNVKPVIQASDLLILDDAHGGEHFVSDMWTVHISAHRHEELYQEALTILRPTLSDNQYQIITDQTQYGTVELTDIPGHPEVITSLISLIDDADYSSIYFPWSLIRNKFNSCLVFVSQGAITIRPIIPPTHTHEPFAESSQKIYMSATIGGEGDLLRSYGITSIKTIRAQHPQWGKRYIFAPGLYLEDEESEQLISEVWNGLDIHRALLLAPSSGIANNTITSLAPLMKPPPTVLTAKDIEDSLTTFTDQDNIILALAGRYDGLDLPGDDCRLLLMIESPSAVGVLERHQREHWKLGPLLRRREQTRLVQGMGRCTRDATDFAIIILLGQSLINSITSPDVTRGLPGEIQRELNWGIIQSEEAKDDPESLKEMISGLLNDSDYRKDANEDIEETDIPDVTPSIENYETSAKYEVLFNRAFWENNFSEAYKISRDETDKLSGPELGGYCAWWFYLGAITAHILNEKEAEIDCLKRARAIGINSGFLDRLLRKRADDKILDKVADVNDTQAEAIWNMIESLGWHGPKFGNLLNEMLQGVSSLSEPTQYHIGLEILGQCLGAETIRPTEDGAPDVVWIFTRQCFTLEAKSKKKPEGRLSKKNVIQAKGHPDWLIAMRPELAEVPIQAVIISPTATIDELAKPHADGLNYILTDRIIILANEVKESLAKIRTEFSGTEYSAVISVFKTRLKESELLLESIIKRLSTPLLDK